MGLHLGAHTRQECTIEEVSETLGAFLAIHTPSDAALGARVTGVTRSEGRH
jgi:hypothetical protein